MIDGAAATERRKDPAGKGAHPTGDVGIVDDGGRFQVLRVEIHLPGGLQQRAGANDDRVGLVQIGFGVDVGDRDQAAGETLEARGQRILIAVREAIRPGREIEVAERRNRAALVDQDLIGDLDRVALCPHRGRSGGYGARAIGVGLDFLVKRAAALRGDQHRTLALQHRARFHFDLRDIDRNHHRGIGRRAGQRPAGLERHIVNQVERVFGVHLQRRIVGRGAQRIQERVIADRHVGVEGDGGGVGRAGAADQAASGALDIRRQRRGGP